MNDITIDARGKACPIPVVMAKKEAAAGKEEFSVLVDNITAVENLKRLGASSGFSTVARENGTDFEVKFTKVGEAYNALAAVPDQTGRTAVGHGWAVFIGKEQIGEGDPELGGSLMKMFLYTLTQDDDAPSYILFMNSGVNLPVRDEQVIEHLKVLQEKGAQVLVCGTCLNFYGMADNLKVGLVSNMYDIVDAMKAVNKVITIG